MKKIDYKAFQAKINARNPDHPVTEEEAAEALRNMAEFVMLLHKINQREHFIPMEDAAELRATSNTASMQEMPVN